ncbi:hypothetical protein OEZ85_011719 [Tetradesmus obliquus]|uniref:ARID domain-containing protein n=1 Tax=Tetradesmus obliquus TaxID=3088 RepID=A0ABY8TRL0_TETOB|nr:hypothetical protein OEZ85_011719 [Tetradesmus obliquus]
MSNPALKQAASRICEDQLGFDLLPQQQQQQQQLDSSMLLGGTASGDMLQPNAAAAAAAAGYSPDVSGVHSGGSGCPTSPSQAAGGEEASGSAAAGDGGDGTECAGSKPVLPHAALKVACGDMIGTLLVHRARIVINEGSANPKEVSPTEFERLGGRSATKKWKQSIRLVNEDGELGRPVGEWYVQQGLEQPKKPREHKDGALAGSNNNSSAARSSSPPPERSRQHGSSKVSAPPPPAYKRPVRAAARNVERHFAAEAASSPELSASLPHARGSGRRGGRGAARAAAAAAAAMASPPVLLEDAGSGTADSPDAVIEMTAYLEGRRSMPPWRLLPLTQRPLVGRYLVPLRQLFVLVMCAGGYTRIKDDLLLWQDLASQLGLPAWPCTDVPDPLRALQQVYRDYLLRFEGRFSLPEQPAAAAAAAAGQQQQQQSAVPGQRQQQAGQEFDPPLEPQAADEEMSGMLEALQLAADGQPLNAQQQQQQQQQRSAAAGHSEQLLLAPRDDSSAADGRDASWGGHLMPASANLLAQGSVGAHLVGLVSQQGGQDGSSHGGSNGSEHSQRGNILPPPSSQAMPAPPPRPLSAAAAAAAAGVNNNSNQQQQGGSELQAFEGGLLRLTTPNSALIGSVLDSPTMRGVGGVNDGCSGVGWMDISEQMQMLPGRTLSNDLRSMTVELTGAAADGQVGPNADDLASVLQMW